MKFTITASAKINLFLDITGRLKNGYHSIRSVMQSISLSDRLIFENAESFSLFCTNPSLACDNTNIVFRAADAFFLASGIKDRNVSITIEKNIPIAAGLAGGSADCAAALVGLNTIYGSPFSKEKLSGIGASLGADVPFCIMCGTCITEGIGDILTKSPSMPYCTLVIAKDPCDGVSTPTAYEALDLMYDGFFSRKPHDGFDKITEALNDGDIKKCASALYNIFEDVILPEHESVSKIKSTMLREGALASLMSGSGPSVFGIFEDEAKAKKTCEKLKKDGMFAAVCHPTEER